MQFICAFETYYTNTELIHLLKYLRSSNYLDHYQDHFGNKISKTKIAALAISLFLYPQSPYNHVEEDQENVENKLVTTKSGQPDQAPKVMTLSEEFISFLESENHECEAIWAQEKSRSQIVKKEMSLFEATKKRPENLEKLYHILLTIKPTSVEPERAFSAMGLFVTKLRNRLNDESLDALIFMLQYYKNQ